jgi:hypothetical protein
MLAAADQAREHRQELAIVYLDEFDKFRNHSMLAGIAEWA